ncbi:MAG: hypothetical protein ACTSU5_04250 [Promethearchaeota archaeon]
MPENLHAPLVEGESITDSELLWSKSQKVEGVMFLVFAAGVLYVLLMLPDFGLPNWVLALQFLFVIAIPLLVMAGIIRILHKEKYTLFVTNFRLFFQYTKRDKPQIIKDYHYDFFESTETPYFYFSRFSKVGFLFLVLGGSFVYGALSPQLRLALGPITVLFDWPVIIILFILGVMGFLLKQQGVNFILFKVTLTSNRVLEINFPANRLGKDRVYELINEVIRQSRAFINR